MATKRKFGALSTSEIEEKQRNLQNKATKSKDKSTSEQFVAYLQYLGENDIDFMKFSPEKLNGFLNTFWFNVRTDKGELYAMKSLEGLRYSLSRVLRQNGAKYDFTNRANDTFISSNLAFEAAKKELKVEGKGAIKHIADLSPERKCNNVKS